MVTKIAQPSFSAGELAPALWARADLAKYKVGLRHTLNVIVHPHGGVSNRAGTRYIETVKNIADFTRLIPFVAANDDSYILEFGNLYIRVYRNGVRVTYPVGHPQAGQIVEIVTPYISADLKLLKFEQSNDVITIVHPSYDPRELARFDHHQWTLSTINFQPSAVAPTGVGCVATYVVTSGAVPVGHRYVVSTVGPNGEESLPSSPTTSVTNDLQINRANFNTVSWSAVAGALEYVIYKEDNGFFGFIGQTPNLSFVDANIKADLSLSPQSGRNPFASSNRPRSITFHQQRRMFGGTNARPQTIWGTQSGNFQNMNVSRPARDDDALEFTIASRSIQRINHMMSVEDLIVFTPSTEWRVEGPDNGLLLPSSIAPKPQSHYGSSDEVVPIVVGDQILFVLANGSTVRDISYQFDRNKYVGQDLTILSHHLLKGRKIVAWSYSEFPNSVIWCVLSDGALISLTYMREHEVWAWTKHSTRGYYESVTTVPEDGYDVTYFVVRRHVNGQWRRYIERMGPREFIDVKDSFFIDSGLSLDTKKVATITYGNPTFLNVNAHGYTNGQTIEVSTNVGPNGEKINGRFVVRNATTNSFNIEDASTGVMHNSVGWSFYDISVATRNLVASISGLDHLEGLTIVGLADGNVVGMEGELTVTGGSVTLPHAAGRIHLGLGYAAEIETLDIESGQQTVQGVIKSIARVSMKVENTRGIFVGQNFQDMYEHRSRSDEFYTDPAKLHTDTIEITAGTGFGVGGRVAVRQPYPLPMTILSVVPDVVFGG